jgi:hypothetical protein
MATGTRRPRNGPPTPQHPTHPPRRLDAPVFSQPEPTADPSTFKIKHPSDADAYKLIDELNRQHRLQPMAFPPPRGAGAEPQLTLRDVFGGNRAAINAIDRQGQIVFHATGDCGSTRGPKTQNEVTDKMIGDFTESEAKEVPQFALLLGDIVYSFGETEYYYDQFYEPYRNYHAPVLAAAGNHDGMISPLAHATSLEAYLRNFCANPANGFTVTPEAGGLSRTAQIQPGVFFTFDAPFVRILVLYSNTLEDPGVIANATIGHAQIDFLRAALQRIKRENYAGALLFAHHHPPYAIGGQHSSSTRSAPRPAYGRTPCLLVTLTLTSASLGIDRTGPKFPTSCAAMAVTMSRSCTLREASRCVYRKSFSRAPRTTTSSCSRDMTIPITDICGW